MEFFGFDKASAGKNVIDSLPELTDFDANIIFRKDLDKFIVTLKTGAKGDGKSPQKAIYNAYRQGLKEARIAMGSKEWKHEKWHSNLACRALLERMRLKLGVTWRRHKK